MAEDKDKNKEREEKAKIADANFSSPLIALALAYNADTGDYGERLKTLAYQSVNPLSIAFSNPELVGDIQKDYEKSGVKDQRWSKAVTLNERILAEKGFKIIKRDFPNLLVSDFAKIAGVPSDKIKPEYTKSTISEIPNYEELQKVYFSTATDEYVANVLAQNASTRLFGGLEKDLLKKPDKAA